VQNANKELISIKQVCPTHEVVSALASEHSGRKNLHWMPWNTPVVRSWAIRLMPASPDLPIERPVVPHLDFTEVGGRRQGPFVQTANGKLT